MLTEIKRPEVGPNADELTSLTRGRGPRRGNLEALLRYWRPIMKKPGGFRRCLVILANHPELYPLERICAWLHHETTGKWPNEGKKKRRGRGRGNVNRRRRRKLTRSVRRGTRRKKSVDFTENIVEISAMRLAIRESRDIGGVLTQPIAGRQAAVELKAMMFNQYSMTLPVEGEVKRVGLVGSRGRAGQAVQAVGSIILPGDISDFQSPIRSQIYETLTPGGGRDRIPSARRLLRGAGRGARNKFRCPPGFQKGGTFTNREFSTCGAQILGIPSIGPGAPSEGAQRALARLARSAELVREIGDLRKNRSSYDIIRAAQIPVAPKKGSATRRQTSVDLVLARIGEQEFGTRFVRRDGVILEPVVSLQALGSMDEFDDMVDGSLVDRYSSGQIGKDLIPAFGAGLRDVYIGIPDTSTVVKVSRDGGELNPTEMDAVQRVYPTSLRRTADLPDPSASIYALSEATNGRFDVEIGELKNNRYQKAADTKNERIRVQSGRQTLMVPRWVYETFLSRSAPRRAKGDPIFEIVESQAKSLNPFMISTKSALEVANKDVGYHDAIEMRTALFAESRMSANTEVKRIGRRLRRGATPNRPNRGGRTRAIFDQNINGFRCPPGTRNAGQFSDQFGRNCGYSLPRQIVNNLVDLGIRIEDAMERRRLRREERGSVRERLGAAYRDRLAKVQDGLAKVMDRLAEVLDVTEDRNLGRIGPTLEQRRRRADLTPEQRDLLEGGELRDALQNLQNVLEERDFDNADITDVRKAFQQVEKAAQLEAGRITDNPSRNRNQRNIGARIQESIAGILDRLANIIDDRTGRRGDRRDRRDRVDAPRADVVPDRRRRGTPARRVRNTDATAPEANDRNVGNRLGRRNRGTDVPELRELDENQKRRVDRAIQNEYNELGDYWARLLGVDEPTDVEIRRYLRRDRRNNQGNDRRVKERRYRDWLELNEVLQKIDNGDEDIDYEDFVGRLAPNRRDSIVNRINPPQRPRRQRRERREAPPVDAPEANTPDPDTPPVPDADTPDPNTPDRDIVEIVNAFSEADWAAQDADDLDRIEADLNRRMGEYLAVPGGPPPPRAFANAQQALAVERERRALLKREGSKKAEKVDSSLSSSPDAPAGPVRRIANYNFVERRQRRLKKREEDIANLAARRYGEDRPYDVGDPDAFLQRPDRAVSAHLREMFLHNQEIDLGTVEVNGVVLRKTATPTVRVTGINRGRDGKVSSANVTGGMTFRLIDPDGNIVKEEKWKTEDGWRAGKIDRSIDFEDGQVSHNYLGFQRVMRYDGQNIDFRGGGGATELNNHAILYYRGLGINNIYVGAAADGNAVWPRQGFREPGRRIDTLNAPEGTMGKLVTNYDAYKRAIAAGQTPDRDAIYARFVLGDDERRDRVQSMLVAAQGAASSDDKPSLHDYMLALDPSSGSDIHPSGSNTGFFNIWKGKVPLTEMDERDKDAIVRKLGQEGISEADVNEALSRTPDFASGSSGYFGAGYWDISSINQPSVGGLRDRNRPAPTTPDAPDAPAAPIRAGARQRAIKSGYQPDLLGPNRPGEMVASVPRGANGMDNQRVANDRVANGEPLANVPDDFLALTISENAGVGIGQDDPDKRFIYVGRGGGNRERGNGINGIKIYKDKTTGQMIGIKFWGGQSAFSHEAQNENVGVALAQRMGFVQGQNRYGGVPSIDGPRGTRPIVLDLGHNLGYSQQADKELQRLDFNDNDTVEDVVRLALLDTIIANGDRHAGNFLISTDDGNDGTIYPIDYGAGLAGGLGGRRLTDPNTFRVANFPIGRLPHLDGQVLRPDGAPERMTIASATKDRLRNMPEAEALQIMQNILDTMNTNEQNAATSLSEILTGAADDIQVMGRNTPNGVADARRMYDSVNQRYDFVRNLTPRQLLTALTRERRVR